jgi:hypothetical protein
MPIGNFSGNTFVAFIDISGFKELMQQNNAINALDCLYSNGYDALISHCDIEGLFVSDSGILFVNEYGKSMHIHNQLSTLLEVVKHINCQMLEKDYLLTTSIAFGEFSYHQRIEFPGIEKNPVYGQAYVSAYLDNAKLLPKIQPGQCRIVWNQPIQDAIRREDLIMINPLLKYKKSDSKHIYYLWSVNNPQDIDRFESEYSDAYQAKYAGMLKALKNM